VLAGICAGGRPQGRSLPRLLFINVPVGLAVIAVTPLFITESRRQPGRFDLTGAVTSIAGMTALVYAFIRAASDGWADRLTLAAFTVAVVMLAAFLLTESRARQRITPLRLFTSPARAGSYLARLLLVAGMFGMFFFLTQFVQGILGFSPLAAGFAFLPMTLTVFGVSRAAPRLLPRFGPTRLMLAGMLTVIGGMAWLAQVSGQTTYLGGVPWGRCCSSVPAWASCSSRSPWCRWPGWRLRTPAPPPAW
jgi:predicted MFS family arabinose efflux permease